MNYVFTYWEGELYPFTELCLKSIRNIFGDRHIHITPQSIADWIVIDESVMNLNHISFKSDYIRSMLLQKYGGWWFDSDIILVRNPDESIQENKAKIWNLIYWFNSAWLPLVNNGILFTPPNSEWINNIVTDFQKVNLNDMRVLTYENEDVGQNIYEKHSVGTALALIGHEHDFNSIINVNADYKPFWDGTIKLNSAKYGIHIGASLSRWAASKGDTLAQKTLSKMSLHDLVREFPLSVISQYVNLSSMQKY
ncbi:MAG: hypothetical protein RLZZ628_3240 [Bacteroidota bacterium]|jgi:hypothetical protein